jgi:hypothetical protein
MQSPEQFIRGSWVKLVVNPANKHKVKTRYTYETRVHKTNQLGKSEFDRLISITLPKIYVEDHQYDFTKNKLSLIF